MARAPRNPHIASRDGVSPSCVSLPFLPKGDVRWATALDFLCERLPYVDRGRWMDRLANGDVVDEARLPINAETPYEGGSRLYYWRFIDAEPEPPSKASLVFRDKHLLVVDKPHFQPVTPTGRYVQRSLLVQLKRETGIETLSPIHRIDRETAGLVLFGIRPQERSAYHTLFRDREVHKVYEAIARFDPNFSLPRVHRSHLTTDPKHFFRMIEIEGEANSETAIAFLERRGTWARYQLEPVTGKRHQLRVHMNALGLPIVDDLFYPDVLRGPDEEAEDCASPLRLLAQGIAFTDPITGKARRFESRLSLDWPSPR